LQCIALCCSMDSCDPLQHNAIHCCNTMQYTAIHCCNTMQHPATHVYVRDCKRHSENVFLTCARHSKSERRAHIRAWFVYMWIKGEGVRKGNREVRKRNRAFSRKGRRGNRTLSLSFVSLLFVWITLPSREWGRGMRKEEEYGVRKGKREENRVEWFWQTRARHSKTLSPLSLLVCLSFSRAFTYAPSPSLSLPPCPLLTCWRV